MLSVLRRLVVALLLAGCGVVLTQLPAQACKCADTSVRQDVKRADLVFSGVLVDTSSTRVGARDRRATAYEIAADTLYKGDLALARVEVTSRVSSCGVGSLKTDRRYLWFVDATGGDLATDLCAGTAKAGDRLTAQVVNLLGDGTPLDEDGTPPDREPAEFTRVADAEPETLTRLAAPGVALVLVGLLGLVVVRRRSRD